MDLHPDFSDLLAEFVRGGVSFVIVGGYAVGHHARPRSTKDLDLLVSGTAENLERVADALHRFGAPPNVVSAARSMAEDDIVYLGAPPVRIDILRKADGVETEDVIGRAVRVRVGALDLPVIALPDLVSNKRASGRKQDLADVEVLEKALRRKA
jgi:hypothetical protein